MVYFRESSSRLLLPLGLQAGRGKLWRHRGKRPFAAFKIQASAKRAEPLPEQAAEKKGGVSPCEILAEQQAAAAEQP